MEKLISCAFNIDTACVELHFTDGSIYSINCTAVENEGSLLSVSTIVLRSEGE